MFHSVAEQLSDEKVAVFEQTVLEYLNTKAASPPEVSKITFHKVETTGQHLNSARRVLSTMQPMEVYDLTVTFNVEAIALLSRNSHFDFRVFLEMFFENSENVLFLRNALDTSGLLFQLPGTPIQTQRQPSEPSSDSGVSVVGALLGVVFSVAVSAMLYMGYRNRETWKRERNLVPASFSGDIEDYANSDDYSDSDMEAGNDHSPQIFINPFMVEAVERVQHPNQRSIYPSESVEASLMSTPRNSMFRPVFMPTESNIEIPETPRTGYQPSNYEPSNYEPSNYEPSQFSPKEDIQAGEFALEAVFPAFAPEDSSEQKKKKKSILSPGFFSPGRLGSRKKEKKDLDNTDTTTGHRNSRARAEESISRDLRKGNSSDSHDFPSHGSNVRDEDSSDKNFSPPRRVPTGRSHDMSIGVMDEVTYLYSTNKQRGNKSTKSNQSNFFGDVSTAFGFSDSVFAVAPPRVTSGLHRSRPTDYISDESSVEQ